ncbi:TPA: hypothetical protein QDB10_003067 [Burkholderia vietnamiensis]|nr:hypothetical protein [Burkholderia vietnamiensis]
MDERAEFARFMEHMEKGLKREAPTLTREEMLAVVAFSLWQENRRTTPDREAIIEECAKVCDDNANQHWYAEDKAREGCEVCAERIRFLKATTLSLRDTLIEEIAEMVDHMGEGRRLEEYVGAIREMKSGDKGDA